MMIREPSRDLEQAYELKVKLPTPLALKLHETKIMTGEQIGSLVERALDRFLAQWANERQQG
ncbi:MAG: hypothetical protein ACYDDF_08205 [Thermoplasmatota archaeon]